MNHIFDKSAFEQEEGRKNLSDYYEENLDECYEFGGVDYDKSSKKSLMQDFIDALPYLLLMGAFCVGVIYWAFNR